MTLFLCDRWVLFSSVAKDQTQRANNSGVARGDKERGTTTLEKEGKGVKAEVNTQSGRGLAQRWLKNCRRSRCRAIKLQTPGECNRNFAPLDPSGSLNNSYEGSAYTGSLSALASSSFATRSAALPIQFSATLRFLAFIYPSPRPATPTKSFYLSPRLLIRKYIPFLPHFLSLFLLFLFLPRNRFVVAP